MLWKKLRKSPIAFIVFDSLHQTTGFPWMDSCKNWYCLLLYENLQADSVIGLKIGQNTRHFTRRPTQIYESFGYRCCLYYFVALVNAIMSEWLHPKTLHVFINLSCLLHVATLIVMSNFITLKIFGEDGVWTISCCVLKLLSRLFFFNTCTVHLLLFCTMTNKSTIIRWRERTNNYFTNYHTPTCLDTIVSSSGSL